VPIDTLPDKLTKHGRFAHSGVYDYSLKEIKGIDIPWPPPKEIGEKGMYQVYRPMNVLVAAVKDGLFTSMPITRGHPGWVDPFNFRDHAIGFTGENAELEYLKDEKEVSVNGTLTLHDAVAMESYDKGVKELSPYYHAKFAWRKGLHKGQAYDAVMTQITETNALAMVNKGRGGSASAIMDHAAQGFKKVASGLWWAVKRRTLVVRDSADPASEATGFHSSLLMLKSQRASMSDEEIRDRIEQLKLLLVDLPFGDEKDMLIHFMDDLKLMRDMPEEPIQDAITLACGLFDKLDKNAMGEIRGVFGDEAEQEAEMKNLLEELIGGIRKKPKPAVMDEKGVVIEPKDIPVKDSDDVTEVCPTCGGSGKVGVLDCHDCHGTGKRGMGDTNPIDETHKVDKTNKVDGKVGDEPDPDIPAATPGATPAQTPSPSPNGTPAAAPAPAPADASGAPQPPAASAPSASPAATPVSPAAPAAAPAVTPEHRVVYYTQMIAQLMDQMAKDPLMQQLKQGGGATPAPAAAAQPADGGSPPQPVNATAAPATAAKPDTPPAASPAPAGSKPPEPKKPEAAPADAGAPKMPEKGVPPAAAVSKNEKAPPAKVGDAAPDTCYPCKGTGKIAGMICPQCKGSGKEKAPAPDPVADSASSLTALISSSKKAGSAYEPLTLEKVLSNITNKGRK